MNRLLTIALVLLAACGASQRAWSKVCAPEKLASGIFAASYDARGAHESPPSFAIAPVIEAPGWEAASGRLQFLNEDPIGFGGGMNWFGYANGNPLMGMDPSGLFALLNTGGSHVTFTMADGSTIKTTNSAEFVSQLQTAIAGSNKIAKMDVWGHGHRDFIYISPTAFIQMEQNDRTQRFSVSVMESSGTETANIDASKFKTALSPSACIDLHGCNTARQWPWESQPNNIANTLSQALPGVPVTGNQGLGFGSLGSEAIARLSTTYATPTSNGFSQANATSVIPSVGYTTRRK